MKVSVMLVYFANLLGTNHWNTANHKKALFIHNSDIGVSEPITPPEKQTCGKNSFRSTKLGTRWKFLLLDSRAIARTKGMFVCSQTPVSMVKTRAWQTCFYAARRNPSQSKVVVVGVVVVSIVVVVVVVVVVAVVVGVVVAVCGVVVVVFFGGEARWSGRSGRSNCQTGRADKSYYLINSMNMS